MHLRIAASAALSALAVAAPAGVAAPQQVPAIPAPVRAEWRVDGSEIVRLTPQQRLREAASAAASARRDGDRVAEVRVWQAAERALLGLPERVAPRRAAEDTYIETYVDQVGDLDGDRRTDIAVTRISWGVDSVTTQVSAHRGVDGREMWSASAAGMGWVLPVRLGNPAKPSVLFVVDDMTYFDTDVAYAGVGVRTVTALSPTGSQLWQQTYGGADSYSIGGGAMVTPPLVAGVGDALPGAAEDVLVLTVQFADVSVSYLVAMQALAIDGGSGTVRPVGAPIGAHDDAPYPNLVPDLSGDGLADIAYTFMPEPAAGVGVVAAYRVTDGVLIWQSRDYAVDGWSSIVPVGDLTGDKKSELAVSVWTDKEGLAVLSGADGSKRFGVAGIYGFPIGDVDRDGRTDVGTLDMTISGGADIDVERAAAALRFDLRVFSGANGRQVYHVRRATELGRIERLNFGTVGDVNNDRVSDVALSNLSFLAGPTPRIATASELFDGRSGRVVHRKSLGAPLYAAVDGAGADFLSFTSAGRGRVGTRVQQGDTGRELWATTVPFGPTDALAVNADGDRCADIVLVGDGPVATVGVLRGANGQLLWGQEMTADETVRLAGVRAGADRNRAC